MKTKLFAFLMAGLFIVPATYTMNNQQQGNNQAAAPARGQAAANDENKSWLPKIIRDNRAVQAALIAAAFAGATYTFAEPMMSFGSTYARRILLNSQTARWMSLATWNFIYDNYPNLADWIYFQALI